jgi:hypothetical protein
MLSQLHTESEYAEMLLSSDKWHPHPNRSDRHAWEALPKETRDGIIQRGEEHRGFEWPTLPATTFLQFARDGNRSNYEAVSFGRRFKLNDLVMAECVEGKGRFLDDIVDGVWAICEESYWGVPAHLNLQKAGSGLPDTGERTVDLFVAETFNLLAWTYYLIGEAFDDVSPLIRPRIALEIDQRGLTPLEEREDFGWMGFGLDRPTSSGKPSTRRVNNWNPWIVSNWLSALLLVEKDPDRRSSCFYKALTTVDHFIDPYPADGGCDEGPGYWGRAGASLFDCLELILSVTDGKINVYDDPKIQNIGQYVYRAQVSGDYFLNFADARAIVSHSPSLIHGYGRRINDPDMMALGAWFASRSKKAVNGLGDTIGRRLPALFSLDELAKTDPREPLPRDAWLDEIEVMAARDKGGSSDGLYVAVKGGNNEESHNHNDIGNFVVYVDGNPLIIDAGVETYTKKTFGPQRYEIWTMVSPYHTLLPTVDGAEQQPGPEFKAVDVSYACNEIEAAISLDIAAAYDESAGIEKWHREAKLVRGSHIAITDSYRLEKDASEISASFLTPCNVDISESGTIRLSCRHFGEGRTSGKGTVKYLAGRKVSFEKIRITDSNLSGVWGPELTRVTFVATDPPLEDVWEYRITGK